MAQIRLGSNEDDRSGGGIASKFRDPIFFYILEGGGTDNRKTKQENVGFGIRDWSKTSFGGTLFEGDVE